MVSIYSKSISIGLFVLLFLPFNAHAWGERGHHTICEAATKLVREPNLKKFMLLRQHMMGHLCNIPDIDWRDLGQISKEGDSAHFMNPENAGTTIKDAPLAVIEYVNLRKTSETNEVKADAIGSLWWRADEFYNRAVTAASSVDSLAKPTDPTTQQNYDLPYNQAIFEFMTNLGVMGHFVGDASMPYHNSADYDGWASGHGGIHAFYESNCVSSFKLNLVAKVGKEADEMIKDKYNSTGTIVERTRKVSVDSVGEKSEIEKLDKVLTPSTPNPKVLASRSDNKVACPPFEDLAIKEMARSAATLAQMWDQAYVDAKRPDLSAYKSYKYPLSVEYVPKDYIK